MVGFYGISTVIGYFNAKSCLFNIYIYIYIYIYIWFVNIFLNKSELFCTVKWLQVSLYNSYKLSSVIYLRQHSTKHQLYGHLPPITKTIQVRRTRHAGHYWRSRAELISDVLLWNPTYGRAKAGQQAIEHTYSSYVKIQDVALKTWLRWWMIGKSGERGSGISVLAARHDDDNDRNLSGAITPSQSGPGIYGNEGGIPCSLNLQGWSLAIR